jgi:hypothetical protein
MDNDLIFGTDTSDMLSGSAAGDTQLAAAPSAASYGDALTRPFDAAQVVVPEGENIVRIPVAPGEVVELPFPADAQFLARIDNGNLAIKVGDVTVILQGYVEAAGQTPPVIEAANGQPIDIATILAATDPAIDIETAAGPAAGPQGQGADNTGAFFQLFGPGAGLGGFIGAGALDATEGPGAGPVDPNGITILPFGVATELAAVNVPPIITSGLSGVGRSEDSPNVFEFLSLTIKDPDDTKHTISVISSLPPGVTYNPATDKLHLDTKGHYDYLNAGDKEVFIVTFKIEDEHGGSVNWDVSVTISGADDAKDAVNDIVVTNVGANGVFDIPEWAVLANDKDAGTEDVTGVSNAVGGSAAWAPGVGTNGSVAFKDTGALDGSFKYHETDGSSATVTVNNQAGGDITGSAAREILVGTAGAEKIDGGGGNDIVFGKGGGDEIFGGAGDDTLVFDASSKFHGGTDSLNPDGGLTFSNSMHGDVLAIAADLKLADSADAANLDGIETISMGTNLGGVGMQSLTIGAASIQQVSDHTIAPGGVFTSDKDAVRIDGDAVDQLYLSISKDGGNWTDTGTVVNGYHVYAHETTGGDPTSADAYVMVHAAMVGNVHLNADQP